MSTVYRVYRGSPFFATRASARAVCAGIDALPAGEPVTVDWTRIEAVTGAFASEFVKWQMEASRQLDHAGMNDEVLGTFALARKRLGGDDEETLDPVRMVPVNEDEDIW